MFAWFDTKEVDAFAQWVIDDLRGRLPPASLERPQRDQKIGDRVHRLTEAVSARARDFARTHKPNFYQRARLGNRIKWAMKDAGYAADFADTFTYELVTLITLASRG